MRKGLLITESLDSNFGIVAHVMLVLYHSINMQVQFYDGYFCATTFTAFFFILRILGEYSHGYQRANLLILLCFIYLESTSEMCQEDMYVQYVTEPSAIKSILCCCSSLRLPVIKIRQ